MKYQVSLFIVLLAFQPAMVGAESTPSDSTRLYSSRGAFIVGIGGPKWMYGQVQVPWAIAKYELVSSVFYGHLPEDNFLGPWSTYGISTAWIIHRARPQHVQVEVSLGLDLMYWDTGLRHGKWVVLPVLDNAIRFGPQFGIVFSIFPSMYVGIRYDW